MKFLVAFAVIVAVVGVDVARSADVDATILRSDTEVKPDGFQYAFETSNGIVASAQGTVKDPNTDHASQVVVGESKYTSPEGAPIVLTYIADENGYQPKGDHLPVAPEIPEAIVRALKYIEDHPQYVEKVAPRVAQVAPVQTYNPQATYRKPTNKF